MDTNPGANEGVFLGLGFMDFLYDPHYWEGEHIPTPRESWQTENGFMEAKP